MATNDQLGFQVEPSVEQFALWALETLELPVHAEEGGVFRLGFPEPPQTPSVQPPSRRFTFNGGGVPETSVERVTAESNLFRWLVQQLRQVGPVVHAAPRAQPISVHQVIPRLFEAYRVDGGSVHLSGCQIDDRPLVRLSYHTAEGAGGTRRAMQQAFMSIDGTALDPKLLVMLRVADLQPFRGRRPRHTEAEISQWVERASRTLAQATDQAAPPRPELATLIWCKYVDGRLSFVIGSHAAQVRFEGWAQLLADQTALPPPYTCPWTGRSSYHLAATDDGRITVAEAIAACAASGKRVLINELRTCDLSGKHALPEYLQECPITQQRLLRSLFIECPSCHQQVSPAAMQRGRCSACRTLVPVSKDDPRMARILGEHPRMDRWRRWRLSETANCYICAAGGMWQRLFVIFDKQTLDPLHAACAGLFSRRWEELSQADVAEFFREAES